MEEYEEQFDGLLIEMDLFEDVAMNCYMRGLRSYVQQSVLSLQPTSLASAMKMARCQVAMIFAFSCVFNVFYICILLIYAFISIGHKPDLVLKPLLLVGLIVDKLRTSSLPNLSSAASFRPTKKLSKCELDE